MTDETFWEIVRARFDRDRSYSADRDPAALRKLAADEAVHIVTAIARALGLTPPPLPALPR